MVAAVTGFPARIRRRPHDGPAASRRYERRRPEKTPLHKVVSENLESWLAWREAAERPVSGYVEDELRGYLECGILCFGFARAVCMSCRMGFVVAFSCKGRGVCPSCNGRHMAQTAAHLADHVIPPVPVRQWVISVPKRLRGMLADRPRAVAALTKIFLDEVERLLCAAAGVPEAAKAGSQWRRRTLAAPSSSTGSSISSRRRGSTAIASTGSLHRTTSCEKPSRRWPSGTSASGATPLPAGMGAAVTPRKAAATRIKSPARTTPPGLLGRNSWPGWGRSFRSSARTVAATSG